MPPQNFKGEFCFYALQAPSFIMVKELFIMFCKLYESNTVDPLLSKLIEPGYAKFWIKEPTLSTEAPFKHSNRTHTFTKTL